MGHIEIGGTTTGEMNHSCVCLVGLGLGFRHSFGLSQGPPCVPFEPSVPMPPRHTPWVYGIETADICILGASWPPPAHERTAALRTCRADTAKAQASSYRFEESWGGQALKPKKPKEFKKNANPKPQNPKETQKAPLKGGRASRAVASALGPTPGSVESRKRPLFRWALGGLGV